MLNRTALILVVTGMARIGSAVGLAGAAPSAKQTQSL